MDKFDNSENINKARLTAIKRRVERAYYDQPQIRKIIAERLMRIPAVDKAVDDINPGMISDTQE